MQDLLSPIFAKRVVPLFLVILLVGACANSDDGQARGDPYETFNRQAFGFNTKLDDVVLEPAARAYLTTPALAQTMLTNFADWTTLPSTTANSIFQGDIRNAGLGVLTFLVNGLTLGLADLTEPQDDPVPTSFDDTMQKINIGAGNYVVLPFLGSGTTRSHTAWVVDAITNPLGFASSPAVSAIRVAAPPARAITFRGNNYDWINDVKYNALDPYARTRSIYFQSDDQQDNQTNQDEESTDDFDDFIEAEQ